MNEILDKYSHALVYGNLSYRIVFIYYYCVLFIQKLILSYCICLLLLYTI